MNLEPDNISTIIYMIINEGTCEIWGTLDISAITEGDNYQLAINADICKTSLNRAISLQLITFLEFN